MPNSPSADAHLQQFAKSHVPGLVLTLPFALTPSVKLGELVGLVLGESIVDGVRRGLMVSLVPRAEVSLYISRADARTIPTGRPDALPIFVKDRGVSHAFLLPIPDQLRRGFGAGGGRRGPARAGAPRGRPGGTAAPRRARAHGGR